MTKIISPYRVAPFNCLAARGDVDLVVLFLAETEPRRLWRVQSEAIRFAYEVLPAWKVGEDHDGGLVLLNPTILPRLVAHQPDVVICGGWRDPSMWLAMLYCRFSGAKLILWSESTQRDHHFRSQTKERIKRWVVSQAHGYIVPGKRQRAYLEHLGANPGRVWRAPNAVDVDYFSREAERFRADKEGLKKAMGLAGSVVLYVGRLTESKGVSDLLAAFSRVAAASDAHLLVVGHGPQEERYRRECEAKGLARIRFEGFRHQIELPRYYAVADVFVFPTRGDPWGLVLNEAMASGLPVVCSDAAGAADDLVADGENGFLYRCGETDELVDRLGRVLSDAALRDQMGARSREIIRDYTPVRMADGFANAILDLGRKSGG